MKAIFTSRHSGASSFYTYNGYYFPIIYSSTISKKAKDLLKKTFEELKNGSFDLPENEVKQLSQIARAACSVFYGQNQWTEEDVHELVEAYYNNNKKE